VADFEEHPSKVAAWRNGHFIVLPDAAGVDCTIWFGIAPDESGEVRWEGLLGRRLGEDHALVCAVPFWLYDLNLGDEVRTIASQEGELFATTIIRESGNYTFRAFLTVEEDDDLSWRELQKTLEPYDCWFDVRSRRFIAISCPPDQAQGVADDLASRERRGELRYETGRTTAAPAE
jgi:Domain of unknown function (DUF4265)